jgi:hypothetical protein
MAVISVMQEVLPDRGDFLLIILQCLATLTSSQSFVHITEFDSLVIINS